MREKNYAEEIMKRKKRPLTLLEIMIVILLIGLIGSVIGYNMKGSLDEGKAFKTRQGAEQIRDILLLEIAKGTPRDTVIANPARYLKQSGLVKDVNKLMKDGWNNPYEILPKYSHDISVVSERLISYDRSKNHGLPVIEEPQIEENEEQ